jgi:dipeptidyl-peptidase-4
MKKDPVMEIRLSTQAGFSLLLLVLFPGTAVPADPPEAPPLLTVAEKSEFKATSRHAEVVEFCEALARRSPVVRVAELGRSGEGRKLPLLIVADPPVRTPEEAARSGKLVVFALGNIHAGEVDGKEALLMLARDLAIPRDRPLLGDLVVVLAPLFNADGNERISRDHRREQFGPEAGVGVRENAAGLDLNRDFVKLDSPEVRALVRFFNHWDPAIFIDCHTTNGSYHRYTITYEGPVCPAGDPRVIALVRDELLPEVGRRLEKRSGYRSFFYGNFAADHTLWETVPAIPRYGTHYFGLRNRIGILSESYSYAPYRERILATRDFVRLIFEYGAQNRKKIQTLLADARESRRDTVAVRHRMAPLLPPVSVLGFEEEKRDGRVVATSRPRDYPARYLGVAEPTLSVRRPWAYLYPATWIGVTENLRRHGIAVAELREETAIEVEAYRIDKIRKTGVFQKRSLVEVEAASRKESRRLPAGTLVVRTAQPLGALAVFLLEPQSEDGLCAWGFFEDAVQEGKEYPVLRLPAEAPLKIRPVPDVPRPD